MRSQPNDKRVNSAKDLDVCKLGYELAMEIFELGKHFPQEETAQRLGGCLGK